MPFDLEAKSMYTFKRNLILPDEQKKKVAKYLKLCASVEPIFSKLFQNCKW